MIRALLWTGLIVSNLAMSYGFAMLGEPTSVWFWGDILGAL